MENAGRLLKEGKAHAVKWKAAGGPRRAIAAIVAADIPVMGHIGLTPQSVHRLGGFRVQRDERQLLDDALAVQEAGAFAVVVECVPAEIATKITQALKVPTDRHRRGAACDGQVLVAHDMLGLFDDFHPRFAKQFADLGPTIVQAAESYCREVPRRHLSRTGAHLSLNQRAILRHQPEALARDPSLTLRVGVAELRTVI